MDVRCERCKTGYEFDDARVTEAGVTVKCTTCGHVFKVKKKALVVTVPVKPSEIDQASPPIAPPLANAAPAAKPEPKPVPERTKDWKVRQANGNVFTFKELTTLQKWIVERKVSRDDEISLTGESWKRLGNIAELASFFQVVDEAQKGQQFSALQSSGMLALQLPSQPGQGVQMPLPFGPPAQAPLAQQGTAPMHGGPAPVPPVAAPVVAAPPPAVAAPPPPPEVKAVVPAPKRKGGAGKWVALLLLLLGGGGYGFYAFYWEPQQRAKQETAEAERVREQAAVEAEAKRRAEAERKAEAARKDAERQEAERQEAERQEAERKAAAEKLAASVDAGVPEPVVVAPVESPPVESPPVPVVTPPPEPKRSFDGYMRQGDRLREREKSEAALDAYAKAAEMEPSRAEPIAGRGLALLDMGSKLQAQAAFEQALRLNPRYGVALMGLAETYRAQGKNADAIRYYERYLDVLPNGSEAPVARANIKKLQE